MTTVVFYGHKMMIIVDTVFFFFFDKLSVRYRVIVIIFRYCRSFFVNSVVCWPGRMPLNDDEDIKNERSAGTETGDSKKEVSPYNEIANKGRQRLLSLSVPRKHFDVKDVDDFYLKNLLCATVFWNCSLLCFYSKHLFITFDIYLGVCLLICTGELSFSLLLRWCSRSRIPWISSRLKYSSDLSM